MRELFLGGVLQARKFVATSAEELQAPYVGQSAGKIVEKVRFMGG